MLICNILKLQLVQPSVSHCTLVVNVKLLAFWTFLPKLGYIATPNITNMTDNIGLPQLVMLLLWEQENSPAKLTWNIFKSDRVTKLTLSWLEPDTNSADTGKDRQTCATGFRRKTPSELRRDKKKKEEFRKRKHQQNLAGKESINFSTQTGAQVGIECKKHDSSSAKGTPVQRMKTRSVTKASNKLCDTPENMRDQMNSSLLSMNVFSPAQVSVTSDRLISPGDLNASVSDLETVVSECDGVNITPCSSNCDLHTSCFETNYQEDIYDSDSSDGSDDISGLGECGDVRCEYAPSVVEGGPYPEILSEMFVCTNPKCNYDPTRDSSVSSQRQPMCQMCHKMGGHKRHTKWIKLVKMKEDC